MVAGKVCDSIGKEMWRSSRKETIVGAKPWLSNEEWDPVYTWKSWP